MSKVLIDASYSSTVPRNHARIGYKNYGFTAVFTASTSATDFPPSSLNNAITMRRWKPVSLPATITADMGVSNLITYVAVAAHTFATNGNTIEFSYSTNGTSFTSIETYAPTDDGAIMLLCHVTARYIRITITNGTVPSVGVMYLGEVLEMEQAFYQGHTPQTLARTLVKVPRISESGQFLSSLSVRSGTESGYSWKNLSADFYRNSFVPFVDSLESYPCFMAWNPLRFDDVIFGWTNETVTPSITGPRDLMSVSLSLKGLGD